MKRIPSMKLKKGLDFQTTQSLGVSEESVKYTDAIRYELKKRIS